MGSTHPSPLQQVTVCRGSSPRTLGSSDPRASSTGPAVQDGAAAPVDPRPHFERELRRGARLLPRACAVAAIGPVLRSVAAIGRGGGGRSTPRGRRRRAGGRRRWCRIDVSLWVWQWGWSGAEGTDGRMGREGATARRASTPDDGWRWGRASAPAGGGGGATTVVSNRRLVAAVAVGMERRRGGRSLGGSGGSDSAKGVDSGRWAAAVEGVGFGRGGRGGNNYGVRGGCSSPLALPSFM